MKKLGFLIGSWAGEANLLLGQDGPIALVQTEDAQYKLDGSILAIEGVGRRKVDGKALLQALAIVSYDDDTGSYHMRAFNDGRFMESEVKLVENGRGITWGFDFGHVRTNSTLRITHDGDWTEIAELFMGTEPPRKFMELKVSPTK